jgi:hypothetical protein
MKRMALIVAACLPACAATVPRSALNDSDARASIETAAYSPMGSACGGLERSDELVCRSELRISRAREAGDPAVLACFMTKSSELQATYRFASATRDDANALGEEAALARERLAAAEKAMEREYAALDECARLARSQPDSLSVSRPSLGG